MTNDGPLADKIQTRSRRMLAWRPLQTAPAYGERLSWAGVVSLATAAIVLFGCLDYALLEPDESRYAELPRLMARTGDYLVPKLEGKPYNDKPPLVYWLIAAGYGLFGVEAWVGRAVCALAGWLTIVAVYFWSRRAVGEVPAVLATLVLQSMIGFLVLSRMLLLDSVLSLAVVGGLLAGQRAVCGPRLRWSWWLAAAVLTGCGMLAKGPVAVVLVFPCLFAYRWLDRSSVRWGLGPAAVFAGVVAVIALPWYAAMLLTTTGFAQEHLWRHHIMRFIEPFHHAKPFWYYGPFWFAEMLPWSGVALLALGTWRNWPPAVRFAALSSVWIFLFFSASKGKLPTYLLPLLPLNAIVVGWFLHDWVARAATGGRGTRGLLAGGLVILILAMAVKEPLSHWLFGQPYDPENLAPLALLPLAVLGWCVSSRRMGLSLLLVCGWCVGLLGVWQALPNYANEASRGQPAAVMIDWARERGLPAVAFRNAWPGASFYHGREELPVFHKEDEAELRDYVRAREAVLVLMRHEDDQLGDFVRAIPSTHRLARVFNRPTVYGVVVERRVSTESAP